ncbi:nucleotidyl transferase AbiEii/AbiGii toxin family protein [[Flexibacter] sp. ATCC 35208]|uniref:nucleotidyl transferase AbiEii/AbiGii toxin family protein n=1 Tax=[Flexibacter] sp. ATCC 35208 TaxID=1936242 RepID=UPI0009CE98EC|nr:nucleotidyl transferase AbiEii/AbiGii toxin family protein [[Flexibacter] sp. ATCC 35208]OMP74666.1 hypothetical protein BW716_34145 [[Flexibacter] sp. ATCC 35208]
MNLSSIREEDLKEVFDALEEAFGVVNIDYYLIGAIARDVWYTQGGKAYRTSKDVDFAALVGSRSEYEAVRKFLIEKKGFKESKQNAFVMINPKEIQIDILPFGGIEIDSQVKLDAVGMSNIQVNGFQEVYVAGTATMNIKTGHAFKVATLPAIVLLKLIAFDDRPEKREKDPRDIANITEHFFELQMNHVYDEHNDLFKLEEKELESLQLEEVSATVIGREIEKITRSNEKLYARVISILQKHIEAAANSQFARLMATETGRPVTEMVNWLQRFKEGMVQS